MQTHNQHREKHSMAACINWTFIIIVLVLFLAVLRYDFHRATYAFQSHQKDWFIFYIKLSYAFVMAYFPHFFGTFIFFLLSFPFWIHDSCNKCLENSDCLKKHVYMEANGAHIQHQR